MQFFQVCLAGLIPASIIATPLVASEASPAPAVGLSEVSALLTTPRLEARQDLGGDLGGILANLSATLHELEILISPDSLADVESLVVNGAKLLSPSNTQTLVTLIQGTGSLLNSSLVGDLEKILPSLLSALPGLLSALPSLGKLINAQMIQNLTDIVSNAHALLDPTMVADTKGLIEDIYPIVSAISKLVGGLLGDL